MGKGLHITVQGATFAVFAIGVIWMVLQIGLTGKLPECNLTLAIPWGLTVFGGGSSSLWGLGKTIFS